MSKGARQAAARPGDYCEPARAKRDRSRAPAVRETARRKRGEQRSAASGSVSGRLLRTCPSEARPGSSPVGITSERGRKKSLKIPKKMLTNSSTCAIVSSVPSWCHGSVGRAHRSHRWGHRFESCWHHQTKNHPIEDGFFVYWFQRREAVVPPAGMGKPLLGSADQDDYKEK